MQIEEPSVTEERSIGKGVGNALEYFARRGMLGSHYEVRAGQ